MQEIDFTNCKWKIRQKTKENERCNIRIRKKGFSKSIFRNKRRNRCLYQNSYADERYKIFNNKDVKYLNVT